MGRPHKAFVFGAKVRVVVLFLQIQLKTGVFWEKEGIAAGQFLLPVLQEMTL